MLIRIRWTCKSGSLDKPCAPYADLIQSVLEADYAVALQLLLKYPAPQPPHGPQTFVGDALFLKDHLDRFGGANLILKYTGRAPMPPTSSSPSTPRPSTPTFPGLGSLRPRTLAARSPLGSPSRFIQNRETVEALFQGAAKGVIERGEKLGINQAVRDAMGEIRRNMQGLQDSSVSRSSRSARDSYGGGNGERRASASAAQIDRRNKMLAAMLDETVSSLRSLASSGTLGDGLDKEKASEALEMAAARIQFVQVYLEDTSLRLPEEDEDMTPPAVAATAPGSPPMASSSAVNALSFTSHRDSSVTPTVAIDKTEVTMSTAPRGHATSPSQAAAALHPGSLERHTSAAGTAEAVPGDPIAIDSTMTSPGPPTQHAGNPADRMDTDDSEQPARASQAPTPPPTRESPQQTRPPAPIPTRSTLAQSSFAWMLEPDTAPSSSSSSSSARPGLTIPPAPRSFSPRLAASHHSKRPSNHNASRERNAFLFGEVTADSSAGGSARGRGGRPPTSDDIFGLEPLRKALPRAVGKGPSSPG